MAGFNSLLWFCTIFASTVTFCSSAESDFAVSQANGEFTVNFLKTLIPQGKNVAFSPASLFTGLAMLYEGMGDSSRQILNRALNLPANHATFAEEFAVSSKKTKIGS